MGSFYRQPYLVNSVESSFEGTSYYFFVQLPSLKIYCDRVIIHSSLSISSSNVNTVQTSADIPTLIKEEGLHCGHQSTPLIPSRHNLQSMVPMDG